VVVQQSDVKVKIYGSMHTSFATQNAYIQGDNCDTVNELENELKNEIQDQKHDEL
jgi:hypothetical protein